VDKYKRLFHLPFFCIYHHFYIAGEHDIHLFLFSKKSTIRLYLSWELTFNFCIWLFTDRCRSTSVGSAWFFGKHVIRNWWFGWTW
jgi:hypothetical protein